MNKKAKIVKLVYFGLICAAISLHGTGISAAVAEALADRSAQSALGGDARSIGGLAFAENKSATVLTGLIRPQDAAADQLRLATFGDRIAARKVDPTGTGFLRVGVFNSVVIPAHGLPVTQRWMRIMRGISDCSATGSCADDSKILGQISSEIEGKSLLDKVRIVNSIVNETIRYRSDRSLYGKLDHWATPTEILKRSSGDCEDFAILKMAGLIRAGIPARSLSLVVLRDKGRGVLHAVLAVMTSSGTLILDNALAKIATDTDLPNYQPLYSLSDSRAWIHGTRTSRHLANAEKGEIVSVAQSEGYGASNEDPGVAPLDENFSPASRLSESD